MNRDAIPNMPAGKEMDILVAEKVMGLSLQHLLPVYEEGSTDDGLDGWSGFVCPRCRRPSDMLDEPCTKYYSTDIRAAWEVVEKFYSMRLDRYSNGQEWRCYLVGARDGKDADARGVADTASLAICRAALLLVLDE